jgi:aspartate aminotransferase-like enzyme
MLRVGHYIFKCADTRQEFEQIHCLNYRTFVSEIPQHPDTGTGMLVDKFHGKNAYLIVLREDRVVGMLSAHDEPPFSVAERLPDPGMLTSPGMRPLEVRLLAIEPRERNSILLGGLMWELHLFTQAHGHTHLFISGVDGRLEMYEKLGFVRLGPSVRGGNASFVPMMMPLNGLSDKLVRMRNMWEQRLQRVAPHLKDAVCLLPGPVTVSPQVRDAFHEAPIYHRGPEFIRRFVAVRRLLADMTGAREVAILNGSGTLGNETVAAALAAMSNAGRGVLLINGEFGQRLARQATRFGLQPRILTWPWGEPWNLDEVEAALRDEPEGSWVWGVHQESSTGVLNDLAGLVAVARKYGIRVCVDCISSLGAVPIDLNEVFLATGSTGKALGSYAGAALIFADPATLRDLDRSRVPSYFDIVAALDSEGPCYTFPSPTLRALEAALQEYATPERARATYARYSELGTFVRGELRRIGLDPLARDEHACPVVTTFAPPGLETSTAFVARCRLWGFAIGGQSGYLAEKRMVQIATMGAITRDMFSQLFEHISRWLSNAAPAMEAVALTH